MVAAAFLRPAAAMMQPDANCVVRLRIRRSGQTTSSGAVASLARTAAATSGSAASEQRRAKRKKDAPDLEAIDDIAERRKQRRLAKNRATAAVSRCVTCQPCARQVGAEEWAYYVC